MEISYQDIDVKVYKLIGKGTYGKIYTIKSKNNQDNQVYKQLNPYYEEEVYDPFFLKETSIYSTINNSSNLVKINKIIMCPKYSYYAMEHAGESLYAILKRNECINNMPNIAFIKNIISSISRCMIDVNNKFIINADIKPENIMVNNNIVLLTDWSLAKSNIDSSFMNLYEEIQTIWYRSPEQILRKNINNSKIDVWSLGIILIELLDNKMGLFPYSSEEEVMYMILEYFGLNRINDKWLDVLEKKKYYIQHYKNKIPKIEIIFDKLLNIINDDQERNSLIDLLENMLKFDPNNRFDFYDVYNHDFLGNEKIERLDILTRLNSLNYHSIDFNIICSTNQWYLASRDYIINIIKLLAKRNSNNNFKIISRTIKIMDIVVNKIKLDMILINEYISIAYYIANIMNGCRTSDKDYISYTRMYMKLTLNKTTSINKINKLNKLYKSFIDVLKLDVNIYTGIYYGYLLLASGYNEHVNEYYETFLKVQSNMSLLNFNDISLARISMYIIKNKYSLNGNLINTFLQDLNIFEKEVINMYYD